MRQAQLARPATEQQPERKWEARALLAERRAPPAAELLQVEELLQVQWLVQLLWVSLGWRERR